MKQNTSQYLYYVSEMLTYTLFSHKKDSEFF